MTLKRSRDDFESTNGTPFESKIKPEPSSLPVSRQKCPYLDTVNRTYLDFDFEKLCSISLSNLNVYCCLICGKFFQGRGKNTYAHVHSVECFHHVFLNLHNAKIFCLPENYEVIDSSQDDIKRALFPSFNPTEISRLDVNTTLVRDAHGVSYLPGFVGLNNLKNTDYVNVVMQALAHVLPIRDYFLQPQLYSDTKSQLVYRFGEVIRKLWSKDNFKSTVSPHDLLQEVSAASKKHFMIGKQREPIEFLSWLLNNLHTGLGGTRKPKSSIILQSFQGRVRVRTQTKKKKRLLAASKNKEDEEDDGTGARLPGQSDAMEGDDGDGREAWTEETSTAPFLYLTLDIPQVPLFKDSQGGIVIPQVPLYTVLEKYSGTKAMDVVKGGVHQRKHYWITRLPRYLILSLARFTKNFYFTEKNPTIVNFPVKNLELKDYFFPETSVPTEEELSKLSIKELQHCVLQHGGSIKGIVERSELEAQTKLLFAELTGSKYDLVANVVHDSPPGQEIKESKHGEQGPTGTFRVHVFNRASEQWYEIQDLHVQETLPQLITISESCILIYEKKETAVKKEAK